MVKHTPAETSEWVAGNLRQAEEVSKVEVLSDQVLRVSRRKYDPFVAGIISARCVAADTVKMLVKSEPGVEIIANVPKESYWTGDALRLAHDNNIATGAYGDLLRVVNIEDVRGFQPRETEYIERGCASTIVFRVSNGYMTGSIALAAEDCPILQWQCQRSTN